MVWPRLLRALGFCLAIILAILRPNIAFPSSFDDIPKDAGNNATSPNTSLTSLLQQAEAGDQNAQYRAGVIYETGQGVPKNYAEATKWLSRAAEQGFAPAQNRLGFAYEHGLGIVSDPAAAVHWYRAGAEQGHASAEYNLAHMYEKGLGVSRDYVQAAHW
jgi:TPR repeat protein